jgi:transcriptional regulator with XRE-family HTH domain
MNPDKRRYLEAKGFKVGTVAEFLGMSADEEAVMEIRLALRSLLKTLRAENKLSQNRLAKKMGTSQARISKMEAADPTVSTDLLLRALVLAGATPQRIGEAIAAVTIPQALPAVRREETEAQSEIKLAATG